MDILVLNKLPRCEDVKTERRISKPTRFTSLFYCCFKSLENFIILFFHCHDGYFTKCRERSMKITA